jgi:hypothetical protein
MFDDDCSFECDDLETLGQNESFEDAQAEMRDGEFDKENGYGFDDDYECEVDSDTGDTDFD